MGEDEISLAFNIYDADAIRAKAQALLLSKTEDDSLIRLPCNEHSCLDE
ncbi:hypothetical protein ABIE67_004862 [Streptomyces sp. V4I8]